MTTSSKATTRLVLRVALRIAVLIAVIYGAAQLSAAIRDALDFKIMPHNRAAVRNALVMGTLAYIFLMALPFVPGAEIGVAMLTLLGPQIAPLVYLATILSLTLSFVVGRMLPPGLSAAMLHKIGLHRAARLITTIAASPPATRLDTLFAQFDHGAIKLATRYRYPLLALLINLPGNIVIGGGGGIAMTAGLSRVFAPLPFLITVAIAVLPVPLAIMMMP